MASPTDPPQSEPGKGEDRPMDAGASAPADVVQVEWLRGDGPQADVVVSSRVRVARNLDGCRFVAVADADERAQVLARCKGRIMLTDPARSILPRIVWIDVHHVSEVDRLLLVERHLISQQLARGHREEGSAGPAPADQPRQEEDTPIKPATPPSSGRVNPASPRAVAIGLPAERVAIMVNEEDHLRMQVLRSGLQFAEAYAEIDRIDTLLDADLGFAFSKRFGYLTACPTNVGTGVRFSAMLHVPALAMTGEMEKVRRAAADMSLALRGFFGEGSEAVGDFFQLSNQTTLGRSETQLMAELGERILPDVVRYERAARDRLLKENRSRLLDQVHRALGLLKHAHLLTTEETMRLVSRVRLGVVMGLIEGMGLPAVHRLMLQAHPAHLQRSAGRVMTQEQRREARAALARQRTEPARAVFP